MKTIKQSVEVNFDCIEFQDAIYGIGLMNWLKNQVQKELNNKAWMNLPKEEQKKYWQPNSAEIANAEQIYEVLKKIGFCSSDPEPLKTQGIFRERSL